MKLSDDWFELFFVGAYTYCTELIWYSLFRDLIDSLLPA